MLIVIASRTGMLPCFYKNLDPSAYNELVDIKEELLNRKVGLEIVDEDVVTYYS